MNKVINEELINRNKKIGNITSIAGIAILIGGLILSFTGDPGTNTIISFAALIVGFIVAQISTTFVNKFGRNPRFDEIIGENLSKLNNQYTYYVYSTPVSLVLVGPSGLWIPVPVSATGEVYYDNKWKQKGGSFLFKFFGQENIGKPDADAASLENTLRNYLNEHLGEGEMPEIKTVLVLLNPNSTIGDVENASLPIVKPDGLRRLIRRVDRKTEDEMAPETLDKINSVLGIKNK
jgi:hypothetical protein